MSSTSGTQPASQSLVGGGVGADPAALARIRELESSLQERVAAARASKEGVRRAEVEARRLHEAARADVDIEAAALREAVLAQADREAAELARASHEVRRRVADRAQADRHDAVRLVLEQVLPEATWGSAAQEVRR